jgi:phosphomannomutase
VTDHAARVDEAALIAAARSWRDQDPDVETRDELDGVLAAVESGDAAAVADLHDRFASRLAFGTAGLRGALGARPGSRRSSRVARAPPRS